MISLIDVYYRKDMAQSVCVVINDWSDDVPFKVYSLKQNVRQPYIPGEFYRRELPVIMNILKLVRERIEYILIDGYVWLNAEKTQKGLGAFLYSKLKNTVPIIGVAKNSFQNNKSAVILYRGASKRPLFITSIGINQDNASNLIKKMHGENRIPTIIKLTDTLSRQWE